MSFFNIVNSNKEVDKIGRKTESSLLKIAGASNLLPVAIIGKILFWKITNATRSGW